MKQNVGRVAVTGTPGSGKSALCEASNWHCLSVKELANQNGCLGPIDSSDNAAPVDVEKLCSILEEKWDEYCDLTLIDGHLSHHLPVDAIVILRCHPDTLKNRLQKRDYSEEKISHNVESELLGMITEEDFDYSNIPCLEIDTSANEINESFQQLLDWITDGFKPSRPSVPIDWIAIIHEGD